VDRPSGSAVNATTARTGSGRGQSSNASTTRAFRSSSRFRWATAARVRAELHRDDGAAAFGEGHGGLAPVPPDLEDADSRTMPATARRDRRKSGAGYPGRRAVVELRVLVEDRSQVVRH
jgi:hypothetical protein